MIGENRESGGPLQNGCAVIKINLPLKHYLLSQANKNTIDIIDHGIETPDFKF